MENSSEAVDIDVKPDLLTLQKNTQISKSEIDQVITHVDIKTEVVDDNFENYIEVPIKVEIQTEENDFAQIENDNQLLNYELEKVEDDHFENYTEDFLNVEIKTEKNDFSLIENDNQLTNYEVEKYNCNLSTLKSHIKTVHEGPKKQKDFRCETCGKEFGRLDKLNRHVKAVHEGML